LAAIMLVALTFGAGLEVDREHLKAILRNYGLLGRALLANFIVVPAFGVVIARLFQLAAPVATGFLLMAIAPGVPFVLASVRKRGGRLGLAVALALFLPALSIVTVPSTAALVLPTAAKAAMPLVRFIATLVLFQLLPLLIGIVVGGRAPVAAAKLGRPLQFVFYASAIVLIVLLLPVIARDVASVYGSRGMWASLFLVLLSLGTGWILGGPAREDRRVLAIGTALRNIGLCALVATASFSQPQVAATVLVYFVIQLIVTSLVGAYFRRTATLAVT
jgi:predicted Na+-dependent transporter